MFYPYVKFENFPLSTFGDIAWTRGRTDRRTDGRTDRRTDGQTEKLSVNVSKEIVMLITLTDKFLMIIFDSLKIFWAEIGSR